MTTFSINGTQVNGETRVSAWVSGGIDETGERYTEFFGKWLADNKLTTNQIRNVFGEVKRIQMKGFTKTFDSELLLLKPKLAYAKARKSQGGKGAEQSAESLQKVLSAGIDAVFFVGHKDAPNEKFDRFENFVNFFEAVLAYHRAHGGK